MKKVGQKQNKACGNDPSQHAKECPPKPVSEKNSSPSQKGSYPIGPPKTENLNESGHNKGIAERVGGHCPLAAYVCIPQRMSFPGIFRKPKKRKK